MSVNFFGQNGSIRNLSINQSTQINTGWLSATNREDYYSFNFSSRSSLSHALKGMYANTNLQVLNGNGQQLAASLNPHNRNKSIKTTLGAGSYDIKVSQFTNPTTAYNLKYSTGVIPQTPPPSPPSSSSWLDMVFQDSQIRADIKSSFSDSVIDRNEVIKILRASEDDGVVDATEFRDLQNLVSNASRLGMPEYVRVLANKVVNGDAANQRYQNSVLGNLTAGSSSTVMENLINKWCGA